ncbi:hypothetical protein MKZ38_002082 [Zalerion maritima]|uniref:NmrA-like domain-containing protein n=1 Tax=Zalerion maritima TaxID=339359 RepID=A0AAD5RZF9_9PEZI|nr:hypothetical protein MKZ38_002082 [Zalerion maritima]
MSTLQKPILVLGAGELGTSIIHSLTSHPSYPKETKTPLTLLVRPSTLTSPSSPDKRKQLDEFRRNLRIGIISGDLENDSPSILADTFKPFHTVIHAGGMTTAPGTMARVTRAVLDAGVKLYLPWQYGVDYHVIGPEGGMGLFGEQCRVRSLLRSQKETRWLVVSCGMFMNFLFEPFWGVVTTATQVDSDDESPGKLKLTALNSWEDVLTVTTARDIGRCIAELVLDPADDAPRNGVVYIAGDTLTYGQLADVLERETGKQMERGVWPLEYLREEAKSKPDDTLRKYHVVFSEGKGLSWPLERTWNHEKGMELEGVASWVRKNWVGCEQ